MLRINCKQTSKNACIQLPASKSLSNRALMIRCLSESPFVIHNLSSAKDTVTFEENITNKGLVVNAGEAGTALRFGTALYSVWPHEKRRVLTAFPALRERPIQDLVEALKSIGAQIEYAEEEGKLPLLILSNSNLKKSIRINASISSQFVSALCMIAPYLENGLIIELDKEVVSEPYIDMTLGIMEYFGVKASKENNQIVITKQPYQAKDITIEGDWSSACFIYCLFALSKMESIQLPHLIKNSWQGDSYIAILMEDFGVTTEYREDGIVLTKNGIFAPKSNYNLVNYPDLAVPFIVMCGILHPSVTITGLSTLLSKESNRIEALKTELKKVGLQVIYENDKLNYSGTIATSQSELHSWNDHRIAMALSLLSTQFEVSLVDEDVVVKSWPNYWEELAKIGSVSKES